MNFIKENRIFITKRKRERVNFNSQKKNKKEKSETSSIFKG